MPENTCVFQGSRRLVVPLSRSPVVPQSRGPAVSLSRRPAVSWSRRPAVLLSRCLVGAPPSLSQSFPVILSKSRAPHQSRAPQPYLLQPAKQKKSEPPKREAPKSILRDQLCYCCGRCSCIFNTRSSNRKIYCYRIIRVANLGSTTNRSLFIIQYY